MATSKKRLDLKERALGFLASHNGVACVLVAGGTGAALVGLFAFLVFSGFGSSADFIYNQF